MKVERREISYSLAHKLGGSIYGSSSIFMEPPRQIRLLPERLWLLLLRQVSLWA